MTTATGDSSELLAPVMQRAIAAVATGSRRIVERGPFVAALDEVDDLVWLSYVLVRPSTAESDFDPGHVEALRAEFTAANRVLRFEIFEQLHPWLADRLTRCGLKAQGAQPLMLCGPADFRPAAAPAGISVIDLLADAPVETISHFITTAKMCFGEPPFATFAETEAARAGLRRLEVRSAYAAADGGAMVGVGSCVAASGELIGVGTLPPFRGRGVAAAVNSRLVAEQFRRGSAAAWLSAADERARASYRTIGFRDAGTQLNFIDATWDGRTRACSPV